MPKSHSLAEALPMISIFSDCIGTIRPVSYTHLDVYKRQVQQANTPAVASTGFVYKTSSPAPKFNGFVLTSNSIVFELSALAKATSRSDSNSSWFTRAANSFAGFFRRIKWKIIRFSKLSDCECTRLNTSPCSLTEDDCYYDSTVIPDFNYHDKWQLLFPDEPDFSLLAWQIEQGIRYRKSNKEQLYGSFFEFNYPLTAGAIRILWQVRKISPVYGYVPDFRIHTCLLYTSRCV